MLRETENFTRSSTLKVMVPTEDCQKKKKEMGKGFLMKFQRQYLDRNTKSLQYDCSFPGTLIESIF